jgi:carbamoyl-phosphate synthase large subunit
MNILFTNAGRRTYLIDFALDIAKSKKDFSIYVSDATDHTAAFYVNENINTIITPYVNKNPEYYIETLYCLCKEKNIDIIIPLMDYEIPYLSRNIEKFDNIGTRIIVSNPEVVDMCLDKVKTENFCNSNNIPYPKLISLEDNFTYPVVIKKRYGSGSIGFRVVYNPDELKCTYMPQSDIIQTYISGKEYGMDILNDMEGNYLHSCSRRKLSMRAGETDKAVTVYSDKYIMWAKKISSVTKHIGNMDVDFFETDEGNIFFIDFNPRFGGGYPFTHISGYNYLVAIIEMIEGKKVNFNSIKPTYCVGLKGISIFKQNLKKV